MRREELQTWVLASSGFQREFQQLVRSSVQLEFPALSTSGIGHKHDWPYLVKCGSLLAQSDNGVCQDAALRIAQYALQRGDLDQGLRDAAAIILDMLANGPAIGLAIKRELLQGEISERLPLPLQFDWFKRSFVNSITLADNTFLPVNLFQREFWRTAEANRWISVSAPTSAGKSFILETWICDHVRRDPGSTIVFLVPTRALIAQVQDDLEKQFAEQKLLNTHVTTFPMRSHLKPGHSNVLVLTQERLHILLADSDEPLQIALLIVDEAQKIGDNTRGVLLQQAIETIIQGSNCQVIFASPMSENPDSLLADAAPNISRQALDRDDRTVNQNLLWASQVKGRPKLWQLDLISGESSQALGTFELTARPAPPSKRMPYVAFALSPKEGGSLVYVNGAADAEKIAKQISGIADTDLRDDEDIANLIDLSQKLVHSRYALAEVLKRGVAFHYGNMPLILRTEIERLFRMGKVRFLVCTSTLVEGVNLPCKTIFMRGPKKGSARMSSIDFWNLAGRAGRLGQEFQGNIVCVDPLDESVWPIPPPRTRSKFKIEKTVERVLEHAGELLAYIRNGSPRDEAVRKPQLEYTAAYLFAVRLSGRELRDCSWAQKLSPPALVSLDDELTRRITNLRTPAEVILRNPGVSPLAMDGLLTYFDERSVVRNQDPEELLPVFPESNDAYTNYSGVLTRINNQIANEFGFNSRRIGQLALMAVDWMNGYPLARIIANREKRYGSEHLPDLIRQTMKDVEEYARFKIPKYLTCYIDLLRVHLNKTGRDDLSERLFDVNVFLEFGASLTTQLSLMSIGLSRSSTIAVSEFISEEALDEEGVLAWLLDNEWITRDFPELLKQEVTRVIERKQSLRIMSDDGSESGST